MSDTYEYHWRHTPSGKSGTNRQEFVSRFEFLIALNQWNRIAPGVWQYYAYYTYPVEPIIKRSSQLEI